MITPEEVFGSNFQSFCQEDPFNRNLVEGYLCTKQSDRYGSLLITRVNHEECPQLILCTPKIEYPFDKNGTYRWPRVKRVERYLKLDGTNIFVYRYHDSKNSCFVSAKLRLQPFVHDSKFGPFLEMTTSIFRDNPSLLSMPLEKHMDLSFELWGSSNPHLIMYEDFLRLSLLFGRRDGSVVPPSEIKANGDATPLLGILDDRDLTEHYNNSREHMNSRLSEIEGRFKGDEGEVWYALLETGKWIMFKCKPDIIEQICWTSHDISRNSIRATCINAFENWERPSMENIVSLLMEEFSPQKIEANRSLIETVLDDVIREYEFREAVMKEYRSLGISVLSDKVSVMRALSSRFPRHLMGKVYSIVTLLDR